MNDYIRRVDAVQWEPVPKSERDYQTGNLDDVYETGYEDKIKQIEIIPAADVRENIRGKWIYDARRNDYCCSFCGCDYCGLPYEDGSVLFYNFCPSCGAQMEEGQR